MVNKWIAAILSFIIAGLGQLIQGETKKGIIMIVILIILDVIYYGYVIPGAIGSIIGFIIFIYSIYAAIDAYKISA